MKLHVVKRKGHRERFDEKKLYGSVYAACYVCNMEEKECEKVADSVTKSVKKWIKNRSQVDSRQIFRQAVAALRKRHRDAAFMYETHRDVS